MAEAERTRGPVEEKVKLRAYPGELVAEVLEGRSAVFLTRKNIFIEDFKNDRGMRFVRLQNGAVETERSCWVPVFLSSAVLNVGSEGPRKSEEKG